MLVVDDDLVSIMIAETLLKKYFHIHSVTNGYDALKAIEEQYYDIILMDINLGDETMNGIHAMRLIRLNDSYRFTKIFAITAFAENPNDEQRYLDMGFSGLYTKPIIKEDMVEAINRAFFVQHTSRENSLKRRSYRI